MVAKQTSTILGDDVPSSYNDGDIVIAADGVANMCVKPGVTTPPEPWPGMGMVTAEGPPGLPVRLVESSAARGLARDCD